MKDASHYITVLWVARSLYPFPKLQSRARMIKVNTDVSMKNPYDVLKITSVVMFNKNKKITNQPKNPNKQHTRKPTIKL